MAISCVIQPYSDISIFSCQVTVNGYTHNVGTVILVSNHYMVGIVLGILAALVTGAVLAFIVLKHLRKQKKGEHISYLPLI